MLPLSMVSTYLRIGDYSGLYQLHRVTALEGVTEVFSRELDPAWNIKASSRFFQYNPGDIKQIMLQVSLLEFGGFNTAATKSMVVFPAHTSYTNPALPSVLMRKVAGEWEAQGDPDKAIRFIYDFANGTDQLPIRLAVGLDAIGMIKEKVKVLRDDLENAEKVHKDVVLTRTG